MKKILHLILLLSGVLAGAMEFRHGDWEITINDDNGAWDRLYWKGSLVCDNPEARSLLWLKRENDGGKLVLQDAAMDEDAGVLSVVTRQGDWEFHERLAFGKDELRRQYSVVWHGRKPARMWEHNTAFPLPRVGGYHLPCSMFGDNRTYYEEITQEPEHVDPVSGPMSSITAGVTLKGSMDHPGFVFLQPSADYAVTLIANPAALPGRAFLKGLQKEVLCEFYTASCGWALPGEAQRFPEFRLVVTPGTIAEAMRRVPHEYYRETGMVPPADRENWLLDASIYELELGSHGGALNAAQKHLPHIKARGFNTLWVQPIEYLGCYNPEDYFKIRQAVGTEDEYRKFIADAHALGLRVLQDIVPHGTFPRFAENRGVSPFTVSINEDGQCVPAMCFDYSSPEWREYFYSVVAHWMKFGVDGFRVDQCGVSPPNWRLPDFPAEAPKAFRKEYWDRAVAENGGKLPPIEGARADESLRIGPMKLIGGIRKTARSCKADAAILGEGGNYMQPYCDVVVDMPIRHAILKMLFFPPEEYTRRYLQTMEEKYWMDPPDIRRVSLYEIHDNDFRAAQILGEAPSQALRCTWFWNRGVPMVMDGRDIGQGVLLKHLNALRANLEELRRGDIDFAAVKSTPQLFAPLRAMPGGSSICVTSFYPDAVEATLEIPTARLGLPAGSATVLYDAFNGRKLGEGRLEEFATVKLHLAPYGSAVLAFRPAGTPCPMTANEAMPPRGAAPAAIPLTVADGAECIEVNGAYPLKISRRNGMIASYGGLVGGSDILSDAAIPPMTPQFTVTRAEDGASVRIQADFGQVFTLVYTAHAQSLHVKGVLKRHARDSRYAFVVNAAATRRWQLFGADGIRDDFIDPAQVEIGNLGSLNGMFREHLLGPVIHRTLSMPLNPAFPVVRLLDGDGNGMEIVQNDPFDRNYDELMLMNQCNGVAGLHAAFFWNQPSPLSTADDRPRSFEFTIRPAGNDRPQGAVNAGLQGVKLRFCALNWDVSNGRIGVRLGKNGGVVKAMLDANGQAARDINQDVVADNFTAAMRHGGGHAAFDMETQCRILRTDDGVELQFLSWLRNFANHGAIQPPVWTRMSYRLDAAGDRLECDYGVFVTKFPAGNDASLYWRADTPDGVLTIPVTREAANAHLRQWLNYSVDFTSAGVEQLPSPRQRLVERSYPQMMEWRIRSWCTQRDFLARLTTDMPESWGFRYITDYRIFPVGDRIVYEFTLPVMWPHTVKPVHLKPGRYRCATRIRTFGVRKTGAPGTLRFKLSYIDARGEKVTIDKGHVIPDGDTGWQDMVTDFEVPEGISSGEFTTLAYKVFGQGKVQFEEPVLEYLGSSK